PERRSGYDWYGYWPRRLLDDDYAAWAWRQGLSADEMVVRYRVSSMAYEEAVDNLRAHTVPDFWKSRVEDVEARVASLRLGESRVIGTSPGDRPVYVVTFGEREAENRQANINAAAGGRDPTVYHDPAARSRPVVLFVGPVH